jgi:hypothetical protein
MENRHDHPNMRGAAIVAAVLGLIFLGLDALAKFQGQEVDATGTILGAALLILGLLAHEKHKELMAMTPEERDRYWAARQKSWEDLADARARAELGDDYRLKR